MFINLKWLAISRWNCRLHLNPFRGLPESCHRSITFRNLFRPTDKMMCGIQHKIDTRDLEIIWLASWPRSGSTFLRTILWHCFGLRSGSIYPKDLGGNKKLEAYVGHVEHSANLFMQGNIPLIKTHEAPPDDNPAIYIVRNGKDATISLYEFYFGNLSLEVIIEGHHRFGTWANHLNSWRPWERRNTLFLKYEDVVLDLPSTLNKISNFLGVNILNETIPLRDIIASIDSRQIVKRGGHSKPDMSEALLKKFVERNGEMLRQTGYAF